MTVASRLVQQCVSSVEVGNREEEEEEEEEEEGRKEGRKEREKKKKKKDVLGNIKLNRE